MQHKVPVLSAWVSTLVLAGICLAGPQAQQAYPVVDTGQVRCYNETHEITFPRAGKAYFGQDAHYAGHASAYRDNEDGTVTDQVTGLTWVADPGRKVTYAQAVAGAARCRVGGYDDWRLPTIKQLYSLIRFDGIDPDPQARTTRNLRAFIDTRFFQFSYGRAGDGDRLIDSQYASATRYVSTTMNGAATMFGVNFADGRIKGYPTLRGRGGKPKTYYALYVRGNPKYGTNDFVDNGDGTVTDRATGLTWMQVDSGHLRAGPRQDGSLTWAEALAWAEQLNYAGHDDWRLPNAKELQSLVDYTRSPATTNSPAIDPVFRTTSITDEAGRKDWPYFWTGTTHVGLRRASSAVYIAFGRAGGFMTDRRTGRKRLQDVHGAGAQRSAPKSGDPKQFAGGRGPQGDVVRIHNFVRCVRGGRAQLRTQGPKVELTAEAARRAAQQNGEGQGPRRTGGGAFIRRLDRNNDGKVSRSEFDGPDRHFRQLDEDGDGFLTSEEAPSGPPSRPDRRR